MKIATGLAAFVTRAALQDLPHQAVEHAKMLMLSTIASASVGSTQESAGILRATERERGGRAEASIWFEHGARLPAAAAARINAVMSDAAASDDSDMRNITHPGTTAVASALAVAEKTGASGAEVLAAIVLGYEAAGRINTGVIPGLREKGFHGCVIAIFAGAVAAARLLKTDETRTAHAIALAATSIGGIMAAARTSVSREYHAGLAAMLGVEAAQTAARGYTGALGIFEAPEGFYYSYGEGPSAPQVGAVLDGLGTHWHILTDMAIKLVPGGNPFHALAEAAALAARKGSVDPKDVRSITVSQVGVHSLAGPRHPSDLIGLAHSAAYFVAAAVADRDFSWDHIALDKLQDPNIRSLLDKVEVGPPPSRDPERYRLGADVSITLNDGQVHSATVFAPRGAAINGIAWPDIARKCRSLMPYADIEPERIDATMAAVRTLECAPNVSELIALLCPPPAARRRVQAGVES